MTITIRGNGGIVCSTIPQGKKRVENMYWDPDTKEIVLKAED